jgi:nucleoid-associated protein YgaU
MVIARISPNGSTPSPKTPVKLEKGKIRTVEQQTIKGHNYTPKKIEVPFLYNPTELTYKKSNSFKAAQSSKNDTQKPLEFGGGDPFEITLQLFFDTYELHENTQLQGRAPDVREYTDKLIELMQVQDQLGQNDKGKWPPQVILEWGTLQRGWRIPSYITSMTQKFLMFAPDGTPVRATVDLTLKAATDGKLTPQNPTSGTLGVERTRLVTPSDRLDLIAYQEYGDATRWRPIAEANGLSTLLDLPVGRRLVIPSLG